MSMAVDIGDNETDMDLETSVSKQSCSFALVWLCSKNAQTTLPLDHFKNITVIKSPKIFDIPFECISELSTLQNEKVILIISNTLVENVVSLVHDMPNILYIYLFLDNSKINLEWTHKYSKVHGSYPDVDRLIQKILSDTEKLTIQADKNSAFDDTNSSVFIYSNLKSGHLIERSNQTTDDLVAYQIFLDLFLSPATLIIQEDFMTKAAETCREKYKDNPMELEKINEFEKTYRPEDVARWYTRDCFLSRLLTNAFRYFDLEILFKLQFFIVDLYSQINQLYVKQNEMLETKTKIFAGMLLSASEFNYLKTNGGNLISTKEFFETTKDSAVAMIYSGDAQMRPQYESIFFEIAIDCNMKKTKPYADIAQLSQFPCEEQVLFSPGCIFRIDSVETFSDNLWLVSLTLIEAAEHGVGELVDQFKIDLGTPIDYITYGNVLNKLSKGKETEKYYEELLKVFTPSQQDRARILCNMGAACFLQNDDSGTLKNYNEALAICGHQNFKLMFEIYNGIGRFHQSKKHYQNALEYLTRAMNILACKDIESLGLVVTSNDIGHIYLLQKNYALALFHFKLALDIAFRVLPSNHPLIAQCLHTIGSARLQDKNYQFALFFFNLALDKLLRILPADHPLTRQCLNDITSLNTRDIKVDHVISATKNLDISTAMNEEVAVTTTEKSTEFDIPLSIGICSVGGNIEKTDTDDTDDTDSQFSLITSVTVITDSTDTAHPYLFIKPLVPVDKTDDE